MPRFKGFIIVYDRIPELIASVEANARAAVKETADKVVREARTRAPVQTGYLRSSIHAESKTLGKEAEVHVDAPYAPFVEFGTYKMGARPFLYPAVQKYADEFVDRVGKGAFKF